MKNLSKKLLAVLLGLAMVLSLAACNPVTPTEKETEKQTEKQTEAQTEAPTDPIDYAWEKYDEEVVITRAYSVTAGHNFQEGDTDQDNLWTRWYKETYNIKLENAFEIDSSEYSQKIDLAIASGKLPDVFQVTPAQLKQCIELGLIADLTDVYEKYACDDLKAAEDCYRVGFESGMVDGKLYGISHQYFGDAGNLLNIWYRSDWAEALGISAPTTLEEFKAMCIAFRDQDPDGNGIDDTLPLTLDSSLGNGIYTLMFAYGAYPNIWIEKDGKIEYGGIQPEVKAALAELKNWYDEGIIDKDWATTSRNQMKEGLTSGKAGACLYASHIGYSLGVSLVANNPDARILPVAVPSATGEPIHYAVTFPISSYIVVSANCKHPEAAIKCLNGYSYMCTSGTPEECELYAESNGGLTNPFRVNTASDMQQHIEVVQLLNGASEEGMLTTTLGKYIEIRKWLDQGDSSGYGQWLQLSEVGGYAQLRPIIEEGRVYTDMLRGPQTETMVTTWSSLKTVLEEAYTQIICGLKPLDYFDEVVENWKALGGEQITIEMNEEYGK